MNEAGIPEYLHLPLLRDADDERLAKRHRSLELCALRDAGVASTSVVGYLGYLLGCLPEPAPLSARELLPLFRVELLAEKAQRTPADMRVPPDIMERLRSL